MDVVVREGGREGGLHGPYYRPDYTLGLTDSHLPPSSRRNTAAFVAWKQRACTHKYGLWSKLLEHLPMTFSGSEHARKYNTAAVFGIHLVSPLECVHGNFVRSEDVWLTAFI